MIPLILSKIPDSFHKQWTFRFERRRSFARNNCGQWNKTQYGWRNEITNGYIVPDVTCAIDVSFLGYEFQMQMLPTLFITRHNLTTWMGAPFATLIAILFEFSVHFGQMSNKASFSLKTAHWLTFKWGNRQKFHASFNENNNQLHDFHVLHVIEYVYGII